MRRDARGSFAFFVPPALDRSARGRQSTCSSSPCAMTLFEKIIAREIPAEILLEDDALIAIRDVHPQAPIHVLIIPKKPIPRLGHAEEGDEAVLGRLLLASRILASQLGVMESGYRIVINHGPDAGESVPHLHVHLLAGRSLQWPPG